MNPTPDIKGGLDGKIEKVATKASIEGYYSLEDITPNQRQLETGKSD